MRKINNYNHLLFIIYSCAVLAMGAFFLIREKIMMRTIQDEFPVDFIMRFGMFWFISFVLALLFFLLHIRLNKYYFSDTEIMQSSRLGKMAFTLGTGAAVIALMLYVSLY